MRVLVIRASPRPDGHSNKVANEFLKVLKEKKSDVEVEEWTLEENKDIPVFSQTTIQGKGEGATAEEKEAWEASLKVITEFKKADLYVVAAPMWNFTPPAKLVNLVGVLTHSGHTFEVVDQAPKGMLIDKRVLFVCAHMGAYPNGAADNDFQLPYLQHIWKFWGVSEQKSIAIDYALTGDQADMKPLEQAKALATEWA